MTQSTPHALRVDPSLVGWTHLIYALHATSVAIGVLSSAFIVGAFVMGAPSIIAVILNYVKRSEVQGTFLESHFSWQIRTFWWAALWGLIGVLLLLLLVGFPVLIGVGLWVVYRVARGWLALKDGRTVG